MCGIFGFLAPKAGLAWKKKILRDGLIQAASRGDHAAGIAFVDPEAGLTVLKDGVRARDFVITDKFKEISQKLPAIVMAHTRAATGGTLSGPHDNNNNHPFFGTESKIAVIHNGTVEDDLWRKTVGKEGGIKEKYPFTGETDSELCLRMVETCLESANSMEEAIMDSCYNIEGSYALVYMREAEPNKMWFVRHDNPIVFALSRKEPYIVWGSTAEIIQSALTDYTFHLSYFCEPITPKLIFDEQTEGTIVTIEMLDSDPWFNITQKDFVPKGGKLPNKAGAY